MVAQNGGSDAEGRCRFKGRRFRLRAGAPSALSWGSCRIRKGRSCYACHDCLSSCRPLIAFHSPFFVAPQLPLLLCPLQATQSWPVSLRPPHPSPREATDRVRPQRASSLICRLRLLAVLSSKRCLVPPLPSRPHNCGLYCHPTLATSAARSSLHQLATCGTLQSGCPRTLLPLGPSSTRGRSGEPSAVML